MNIVERIEVARAKFEAAYEEIDNMRNHPWSEALSGRRDDLYEQAFSAGAEFDEAVRVHETGIDPHVSLSAGAL